MIKKIKKKYLIYGNKKNLSTHLTKLEELGFIKVDKEFIAKKPCSTYSLTEYGDILFREYVDLLENLINNAR